MPIKNIFPLGFPWQTEDPFLFCVHHRDEYPQGNEEMEPKVSLAGRNIGNDFIIKDGWRMYHGQKIPGFPYHPHRGFETITIAEQGFVDHTDSIGGAGRFSTGDVQWMTAGKGILHSEMFPLLNEDKENTLEIFQIWLNLPAKDKFVEPHFKMLWNEQLSDIYISDEKGKKSTIRQITGNLFNVKNPSPTPNSWAAEPANGVAILIIKLEPNATINIPKTTENYNRSIYLYKGNSVQINNQVLPLNYGASADSNEVLTITASDQPAQLLMLQGKAINEPVAQHGPFVMNTQQEIQEAFQEYRQTHFGGWPWPNEEQVHSKTKGRFALHANGKEEIPDRN